jgi:hypothetical protein
MNRIKKEGKSRLRSHKYSTCMILWKKDITDNNSLIMTLIIDGIPSWVMLYTRLG